MYIYLYIYILIKVLPIQYSQEINKSTLLINLLVYSSTWFLNKLSNGECCLGSHVLPKTNILTSPILNESIIIYNLHNYIGYIHTNWSHSLYS